MCIAEIRQNLLISQNQLPTQSFRMTGGKWLWAMSIVAGTSRHGGLQLHVARMVARLTIQLSRRDGVNAIANTYRRSHQQEPPTGIDQSRRGLESAYKR